MNDFPYVIRNYQPKDFDNYRRICQEAKVLVPLGRSVSLRAIIEHLERPNYYPESDLFLVEKDGGIVGYMDITPELDIGRVILDCWICPEHRRRGVSKILHGYAMRRANELGAKFAHVNIREDNTIAKIALSRLGFKCVRQFLEYRLDMSGFRLQEATQVFQKCYHMKHGEEIKLTLIQNRCFAGTWGYNPNTLATITFRTNLGHFYPEDVILTGEGDKVTGYCWIETGSGESEQEGRIYMLGVDPDYRRAGIGRRLLLAGLAHLRGKGINVVVLTVDSENEGACVLYRSVGFEVAVKSLWYEKEVT